MATKKVNIDIIARDKSQQALNKVRGSLDKVKSSIFNVRNALVGIGGGLAVRSLVNTGKEIEGLQVRLKFLFGSAEEGAKAFDNMAKFASKVPFSLEEIQQGAGVLSVISKDADELSDIMEITGNVAAVTGLDFKTASEQIQRSLSAGIASADLFRERGVRDLLGFKAGATVTAEETAEAFQRVFGKGGQFGGATDELAKTFEGTLSMIGDKFFSFKKTILEAGFFPELKKQFGDLNQFLEDNTESIDAFAEKIGKGLALAVSTIADGFKVLKDNIDLVVAGFSSIIAFKLASTFTNITTALITLTTGMKAFNTAVKANIIFGSIAIFTGSLGLLIDKFREFKGELLTPSEPTTVKELEDIVNMHKSTIEAFEEYKKTQEEKTGQSKRLNKEELANYKFAQEEIIRLEQLKGVLLLKENSKAYAQMKDSVQSVTDEIARNEIKNQIKKNNEIEKHLEKRRKEDVKLFHELKQKETLEKQETAENVKKIQDEMLAETQSYYDKYTIAMSKRYRMERKFIRINKEEEDARLEKYTKAMLIRGKINDEVMSKQETALSSFTEGFKEQMNAQGTALEQFNQAGKRAFDSFADTLTNALMTGKFAFQDFARSVILDITRIIAKQMIMLALQKAAGFFSFGGFNLGGLLSFGGGKAQGGAVQGGKAYMVGEKGPEMFVPNQSGNIVPNNQMGNNQPVNVNFNINTVDARGFNELLVNSRGLIVNMINSAVNEKGRQAIV